MQDKLNIFDGRSQQLGITINRGKIRIWMAQDRKAWRVLFDGLCSNGDQRQQKKEAWLVLVYNSGIQWITLPSWTLLKWPVKTRVFNWMNQYQQSESRHLDWRSRSTPLNANLLYSDFIEHTCGFVWAAWVERPSTLWPGLRSSVSNSLQSISVKDPVNECRCTGYMMLTPILIRPNATLWMIWSISCKLPSLSRTFYLVSHLD